MAFSNLTCVYLIMGYFALVSMAYMDIDGSNKQSPIKQVDKQFSSDAYYHNDHGHGYANTSFGDKNAPAKETVHHSSEVSRHRREIPGSSTNSSNAKKDIYLLGLFPFSGSWPGGLGQLPAVIMGLEDVNSDPSILPGYTIHMTINNTQVTFQYHSKQSATPL